MSAENRIARSARQIDPPTERSGFEIPPELTTRYDVRVVDGPNGEQRLGLFRPGDREAPSIEVSNDRIVARSEDAETVASLVKIAQHNGWDRIDVDGSPEFRKAVWNAATREGLTVSGYEPSFAEAERMALLRREDPRPRASEPPEQIAQANEKGVNTLDTDRTNGARQNDAPIPELETAARFRIEQWKIGEKTWGLLGETNSATQAVTLFKSVVDTRVVDTQNGRSLGTADWGGDGGYPIWNVTPELERLAGLERDGAATRAVEATPLGIGTAPESLNGPLRGETHAGADRQPATTASPDARDRSAADERVIVERAFDRMARELEANGDPRARDTRETASALIEQIYGEGEKRSAIGSAHERNDRPGPAQTEMGAPDREQSTRSHGTHGDQHQRESGVLAELFLHGSQEAIAAEPRLANALRAQAAMEQHIGEVFEGDVGRMTSANLESRQMISDALRRGLDVSVREPTPVRQIDPIHSRPDLER